jgi:predicted CoA-binding protein
MPTHRASLETIQDFLAQKRIAIAGISRDPASFSVQMFKELCRRGYDVVPVNPNATEVQGRQCFAHVQDIHPPVEAVLLMTSPGETEAVVDDCVQADITRVWMYRATGQGAVSAKAVEVCREHAIDVVPGECPFMFLQDSPIYHRIHGIVRKITGKYPRRACS